MLQHSVVINRAYDDNQLFSHFQRLTNQTSFGQTVYTLSMGKPMIDLNINNGEINV